MEGGGAQATLLAPGQAVDGGDGLFILRESAVAIMELFGGAAIGDLDGDGALDLVLSTRPREGETESRVHVLYGFEG